MTRTSRVKRLWKRLVADGPDQYQAYVAFPPRPGRESIGDVHERIAELERVFDGRLDVYARSRGVAVATDRVPAERFDADAFESILERIERVYAGTHRLARVEKRRPIDGKLVTSYVVVPVKPLFPLEGDDEHAEKIAPPAE
ncbi:hypothetical protein HALLA_19230 [Halostagnicola larsenii XH-48]|uniref:Uncharacterized protein n=1 Tax=Halostagnicola larsenii XH-48 TaxID=797299 RepID=W0JTN2_9EURY|nr:hypothetical protein [Halostagnicola larsenii]AHG00605.1 hypothetical protein HALLA_19230 [Halostagnicola larsenii XH-48]